MGFNSEFKGLMTTLILPYWGVGGCRYDAKGWPL